MQIKVKFCEKRRKREYIKEEGVVGGIMQEFNEKKDLSYLIDKIVASDLNILEK
ncbi:MAG: hypothetical protein ACM3TR_12285 [Caulobacteraceae bacterium]